jgi:hypothetical protein
MSTINEARLRRSESDALPKRPEAGWSALTDEEDVGDGVVLPSLLASATEGNGGNRGGDGGAVGGMEGGKAAHRNAAGDAGNIAGNEIVGSSSKSAPLTPPAEDTDHRSAPPSQGAARGIPATVG